VSQTTEDIQLQVWKDLALSKQLLANEVIKALDLDTTVNAAQLKDALNKLIKKANDAEATIKAARENADTSINEIRTELKASEKARLKAEGAITEATSGRESAERALSVGRESNADALRKAKEDVAKKDRELKNINTALADTPENVVKKLKNLKKPEKRNQRAQRTNRRTQKTAGAKRATGRTIP